MRWRIERTTRFDSWWATLSQEKQEQVASSVEVLAESGPKTTAIAVLLVGGDKAGKTKRFYRQMISEADRIYDAHLRRIEKGANQDGR